MPMNVRKHNEYQQHEHNEPNEVEGRYTMSYNNLEIRTERLVLRSVDVTKAEQVLEYFARNKSFLEQWEPLRAPEYYTLETHQEMLLNDYASMEQEQMFKVWLYRADEPNTIIGSITLSSIARGVFQSCHLGYRSDEQMGKKGYMTEGLKAVIRHAFQELKLHRIEANIMPHNAASLRVVEKLGFHREGYAQKYLKINGKWEDHIYTALINDELG